MPDVIAAAARLTGEDAAARVVDRYVRIVGAVPASEIEATFAWAPRLAEAAAARAGLARATVDGRDAWTLPGLWPS
jgi:hypothetical protein